MRKQVLSDAVSLRFFLPSPELRPYISTYYLTEFTASGSEIVDDYLHPEWANLRLSNTGNYEAGIGGAELGPVDRFIATGPTSFATRFRMGTSRIWGIGLLPLGWARFVGAPADEFADRTVAVESAAAFAGFAPLYGEVFSGPSDPPAEAARIDQHLSAMLARYAPHEDEARIRAAHAALVDPEVATVADLAGRIGMSARSLERLSSRAFGFSPKLLLRRQRFLRSLAQFMLDPSLTWISTLDYQYVDQAHFVRDFKRFMGMSPSRYAALDHPVLRAAASARTAATGAAVQALHSYDLTKP